MTKSPRTGIRGALMLGASLAAMVPLQGRAQSFLGTLNNYRLPSGQFLTPAAVPNSSFVELNAGLANYPNLPAGGGMTGVVSPDGRTLVVLTSGYNSFYTSTGGLDPVSAEAIFVYDISNGKPVQKQVLSVPASFAGIAFTPDGTKFYVGSGGKQSVYVYADTNGVWAQQGSPISVYNVFSKKNDGGYGVGNYQNPSTGGLAITADGTKMLVTDTYNDAVTLINLTSGAVLGTLDLRPGIENAAQGGVAGGETPFWVAIHGTTAYVTSERDREIDVLDISGTTPLLKTRIPVLGNPIEAVLNKAGTTLYVAADNADEVHVIDTATNRVTASVPTEAPAGLLSSQPRYRGVAPNALALSADESTLYVTNGGENAVAVIKLGANPQVIGLLPTGYYPNSVAVSNGWMYVVNEKSDTPPNPGNCTSSVGSIQPPPSYLSSCSQNAYILQLSGGGLLAAPIPTTTVAQNLLTLTVAADDNFIHLPNLLEKTTMSALHGLIKHVIYIVKENRTYDQILGDLGEGNGDPSLTEFGQAITPNFHAISKQFVDLDNFEDPGEVSGNGWPWSTEARETDFNIKTMPLNYSSLTTDAPYDAEGQMREVNLLATNAERSTADPAWTNDPNLLPGTNSDDEPDGPNDDDGNGATQNGHIWDAALAAGLSVRNYGFFCDENRYSASYGNYNTAKDKQVPEDPTPFKDGVVQAYPDLDTLIPITDPYYRSFDNAYPDLYRVNEWQREFSNYEATGTLPALSMVRMNHDHMGDFSTAIAGVNTPELQQADDDYSVGLIAQTVAHSKDADDTLIFVVEDDAQDGPDHVDAHRSTAYVIGPYVKQGAVVDDRYTTVNMIATIEDILGMEPLNINDANALPMWTAFDLTKRNWTYSATPSAYLYSTTLTGLPQQAASADPIPTSTHGAAWWAAQTVGYHWIPEDHVPTAKFNALLWRGLMGDRPYPTARSGIDMTHVQKAAFKTATH